MICSLYQAKGTNDCDLLCDANDFSRPVCGSDGKSYQSKCILRLKKCTSGKKLYVEYNGSCRGGKQSFYHHNYHCVRLYQPYDAITMFLDQHEYQPHCYHFNNHHRHYHHYHRYHLTAIISSIFAIIATKTPMNTTQ